MKNIAIILSSGTGNRSGLDIPKQFLKIGGKAVVEHTIEVFENHSLIDEIIIVSHADYIDRTEDIILKNNYKKITKVLAGGATRQESSSIGINSIQEDDAKVLIHDAVRPFLHSSIIDNCINALDDYNAVDVVIESADTIVEIDPKTNCIKNMPKRKNLRRGQTPQAFSLKTIKSAHELAKQRTDLMVTDDCGLVKELKLGDIYVINGDDFNHKITYPIDVAIAEKLFQMKKFESPLEDKTRLKNKVVVIFGASKGIGEEIAKISREYGAKIYGYSRSNGVDVSDSDAVKNTLQDVYKKEGRIDYVINTAGIMKMGKLNCRDISDIINEININYLGTVNVAHSSYEYLNKSKGSLLFFTSSSYTRGRQLYSIYSSSKAAIVNFVQALSEEWAEDGIRVNVICPERTATPMRFENFGKEPEGSLCSAEKVAIASLNTILSGYTGQVIDVRK